MDSIEAQIGKKIRAVRGERDVTLDQLAKKARLTKGQLSKIENGKVSCPISTLMRVASALGIQVGALFDDNDTKTRAVHVRKDERKPIVGRGSKIGHSYETLAFSLPFEKDFEPYLMTIDETKIDPAKNLFRHPGHEFLFVLEGKMTYRHGSQSFKMEAGDSLYFDATLEHGPVAVTDTPVRFLSIISNV